MDFLIELVLDLIFEGSMELSNNKKVPKWIRYILITFIVSVFIIVSLLFLLVSLLLLKETLIGSLVFFIIFIVFIVFGIKKFRKMYFEKKNEWI